VRRVVFPQEPFALRVGFAWTMAFEDGGPLEDALILGDHGQVVAVGPWRELRGRIRSELADFSGFALAPGLVNAHCHLELSHLGHGLTLGEGFLPWVRSLVPHLREPLSPEAIQTALAQLLDCGTAFVADITGRNCAAVAAALDSVGLGYWQLMEVFGFSSQSYAGPAVTCGQPLSDSALRHAATAGHAPYSTHPDILRQAKQWSTAHGRPFSIHLAEPEGEAELLNSGSGALAEFYRRAGILPRDFQPPVLSSVAYADSLGLLDASTLAVHCVHVNDIDIELLHERAATVCLCPRSNARMSVGRAPWEALCAAGVNICLGTDGLTSNADLDLWNELRFFREGLLDSLDLAKALALITCNPACALGIAEEYGSIVPGRRAVFSVLPEDVAAWPARKRGYSLRRALH
jgi:cytosine/adenosine deaminase-related metal-dependent hydrolase